MGHKNFSAILLLLIGVLLILPNQTAALTSFGDQKVKPRTLRAGLTWSCPEAKGFCCGSRGMCN